MRTSEFDYFLPPEKIAQVPAEPRDAARLLDTRTGRDHYFRDLPDLLEPGDLVVVNRTRVRAARLSGVKESTGGRVEALLLGPVGGSEWRAIVKPARRLRAGTQLRFGPIEATVVAEPAAGETILDLGGSVDEVELLVAQTGQIPLPPYIKTELADPERYQTMFATVVGSAAAPTAALHFTPAVVGRLRERGIRIAEIELRIGLDTFRPITAESVEEHRMHSEEFVVPAATRALVEQSRGRVVAIGTTVVRALESPAHVGRTSLYIRPGFSFRSVDLLVTNFHLPRTTLLVLLAAFMGERWRDAYQTALERDYRFASLGDAMLAERAG